MSQLRKKNPQFFFSNTFTTEGDKNHRIISRLTVKCKRCRFQIPYILMLLLSRGLRSLIGRSRLVRFQREGRQFWRVQEWMPTEDEFSKYFRYLRLEKKLSSSTLRKTYSIINAVVKGKYGERLQKHPRLTTLLKSFDTDTKKKVAVFEMEDLGVFVASQELTTLYWLVRKVIMILEFFGGLRHFESKCSLSSTLILTVKLFICFLYIILNKHSYFLFDKLKLISFYFLRVE